MQSHSNKYYKYQKKVIHLGSNTIHMPELVEFFEKKFKSENHHFFLSGKGIEKKIKSNLVTYIKNNLGFWLKFLSTINKSQKIFLHGLYDSKIILLLTIMPWNLKKTYWFVWGGDLYSFNERYKTVINFIKNLFKSFVIKRVGFIVTYLNEDYENAIKFYGAKGTHKSCLMTYSNVFKEYEKKSFEEYKGQILVGNSASPSNNHIEILKKLRYQHGIKKVIIPLSYGDRKYRKKVIEASKEIFDTEIDPINSVMTKEDYLKILNKTEIAFFNHKKQEAMGTTIALLGLGKTVYLRKDTVQFRFFKSNKIKVFDSQKPSLKKISDEDALKNIKKIKKLFSEERFLNEYLDIIGNYEN